MVERLGLEDMDGRSEKDEGKSRGVGRLSVGAADLPPAEFVGGQGSDGGG